MNLTREDWKEMLLGGLVLVAWAVVTWFLLAVGPPIVGAGWPQ